MTSVLAAVTVAAPLTASAATGSTISSAPATFATTNGDILTELVVSVDGTQAIAIGGHFTSIITRSGATQAAANFAVLRESDGAVLYAAPSTSSNGYVRALTAAGGVIYVGGDFTSFAGVARSHVAALQTSSWQVTSWAPNVGANVRALAASSSAVYVGGTAATVAAYQPGSGARIWSDAVSGGLVKGLLINNATGGLYVAGYFDSVGGFSNHGLIEVALGTGTPITSFTPTFLPNNQPGAFPSYNGENPFSLSLVVNGATTYLAVASGGVHNYIRLLTTTTGSFVWSRATVGDAQAVTTIGATVVVGYHRWRTNSGTAWPYFAAQVTASNALTSWNPGLTGTQDLSDNGGNGTMALAYDSSSHLLFVGGAFTTYGASCPNLSTSVSCTGGSPHQSLSAYVVS